MPKFKGSLEELAKIIQASGIEGEWEPINDGGYRFDGQGGEVLSWWPSGNVSIQGKNPEVLEKIISQDTAISPNITGATAPTATEDTSDKKIFVVHGHDADALEQLDRILMKLGLESFVLQNSANSSNTIIEELEKNINHRETSFGIVLLTPDDFGYSKLEGEDEKQPRARQNAILEMGMVMGSLGRRRMAILKKGALEMPSDTDGMLHIPFNDHVKETVPKLIKSLENAGFKVNSSKITEILA